MRILNFVLAVMFLFFAFLQVNDPDPLIWIIIYGIMAVLAIFAMFGIYHPKVIIGILVLYVAYSFVYMHGVLTWLKLDNKAELFDDVAKMEQWYIEESREILGLWICILVLLFYFFRSRAFAPSSQKRSAESSTR